MNTRIIYQGVNKEFQRSNSQLILSGHVADYVGFLTRDPPHLEHCLWKVIAFQVKSQ